MMIFRLLLCTLMFSQPACSQKSDKPVLLMNPSVHIGNGEVIKNAVLAFDDGKITLLADATRIRLDMSAFEVVEAYGLDVYPAALLDSLPSAVAEGDSLFYTELNQGIMLAADQITADSPVHKLEEGAEATFVVTEKPLKESVAQIRYLVVKGRLKRENSVSLRLLSSEP
ncbi:hypothetical protein WJR50_07610 [Catalinimonas sp. 4WD22]|uniref:hypothetical protein n=1 Tax=Catalinimonas locisalis TaxID=3133978 RepID=UPI0031014813